MPIKGKRSLPISDETHKVIGHEAIERGVTMDTVVADAMRLYRQNVNLGKKPVEIPAELKDNALYPWGRMLAKIMSSDRSVLKNMEAIEAVQQSLRIFYRHIGGDPDGDFPKCSSGPGASGDNEERTGRTDRAKKPPASDRKIIPAKA